MFKNVTFGIVAASTIGLQIWIGIQYKNFLSEILEKKEGSESEDLDFDLANLYGGIGKLKF